MSYWLLSRLRIKSRLFTLALSVILQDPAPAGPSSPAFLPCPGPVPQLPLPPNGVLALEKFLELKSGSLYLPFAFCQAPHNLNLNSDVTSSERPFLGLLSKGSFPPNPISSL